VQLVLQQEFHLNLSMSAAAQITRMFDKERTGRLNETSFRKLCDFLVRCRANFDYFDQNPKDGTLNSSEVRQALAHNGIALEPPVLARCFETFDPNQSGSLCLPEFVVFSVFLEECRATFAAFDPDRTGTITLDLQQFMFAGANLR